VSWHDEARNARRAISYLFDFIVKFMQLSVKGDRLDLQNIHKAVTPMVDSVIRNPDACLWWTTMKPAADDSHDNSLRSSVLAAVLGRQLGLPAKDLYSLAIGGLLFDIGKLRLDESILQADRRLTPDEMAMIQRHVEIGLSLLQRSGLTDPDIIDFIANHHERLDCSGYPQGLGGDMIPAFGRIAGVVDCYNAITSSRIYASTRSPAEAINQLYKLKGVHFHKDLIEEFIQAIGVYPVGALVELSTGEVAIVVAQSRSRRLRPVLLVLLDGNKKPARGGRFIVLEKTTHSDDGSKLDIVKNLEPNAYGIDRAAIKLS
jgi:HD-GYP domain-containing protein (c-di-GMP phosphodiesterase class II)